MLTAPGRRSPATPPAPSGSALRPQLEAAPKRLAAVRRAWLTIAIPALVAYVPLLFTHPGMVGADTKTYLYLDPGKLLASAPYVWDSHIGLGTVTHQNIGYLWPMGPFYWVFQQLGVPDWVAQRIWLGSILFAAGLGVRYLMPHAGMGQSGRTSRRRGAMFILRLHVQPVPARRTGGPHLGASCCRGPALPWMIGLVVRATRERRWRHPALFALLIPTVGGINATALILVGLGPLLYVAVRRVRRLARSRSARPSPSSAASRVLTVGTSLWWIAGLWAEGKYGLPVTKYTETYKTVAEVSSAPEVLRGLGYWFFYGDDKIGPWIEPSATVHAPTWPDPRPQLRAARSLAIVAAALVRWRYRAFFLGIVVVGSFTAIASHPWSNPSLIGALFKAFTRTGAGLAMRSLPRAVPLVVLGLALFLGRVWPSLGRRRPNFSLA